MFRGGSHHRIRGLFEKALSNDRLSSSVVLWRCYIMFEIEIANDPSEARRAFFRAIHSCPCKLTLPQLSLKTIQLGLELAPLVPQWYIPEVQNRVEKNSPTLTIKTFAGEEEAGRIKDIFRLYKILILEGIFK
ncbi:unnamed protein product [Sphenostylis stenocarpa]|uniref:Uncharacterized protein n=1 Tax=Sphenostylis stenocarpa TaxID=92480 RepID=A0AA86SCU1_9FABA|nr:unnamed protein product [Sphenostylis stenocarpa]